ncbi:MAG: dihydrodipicolinate synthase family protein [Planctomycetales bacterium]|nr:dihydrodipicolinate synthase family protein [Planctomycetales bacterium]
MANLPMEGIYTPNITPIDAQGRVDEDQLCAYVDWLIERGVHGLYPNGSTGEFTRFTAAERRRIIEVLCAHVGNRVPILAGAAEANVRETIEACDTYGAMGVSAVAIVAPFYYRLGPEAVYQYFKEIGDHVSVNVTLYNIPLFASPIDVTTVRRLALDCPRIVGIKDSSGDIPHMMRMIAAVRPQRPEFSFLTGWDAALAPMLLIGCNGGTNATSGVVPELTRAIYEASQRAQWDRAMQLQYRLLPLFDAMIGQPEFPEGFRRGALARGWNLGQSRQPLSKEQLVAAQKTQEQLVQALSELGAWLPEISPAHASPSNNSSSGDDFIERIVKEVMQQLQG